MPHRLCRCLGRCYMTPFRNGAVQYSMAAHPSVLHGPANEAFNGGEAKAHPQASNRFWALALGSVGVVYGDIGTSPLYAFREAALSAAADGTLEQSEVLGVLSLILWALILLVTIK